MLQEGDDNLVSNICDNLDNYFNNNLISGKLETRNSYGIWKTPLNCTLRIQDNNLVFHSIKNDKFSYNILFSLTSFYSYYVSIGWFCQESYKFI